MSTHKSISLSRLFVYIVITATLVAAPFPTVKAAVQSPGLTAPQTPQAKAPSILTVPSTTAGIKVDGVCDKNEYGNALNQTFSDGGQTGNVSLIRNGNLLFVCMQALPGTYKDRFATVYLDPQGDGAGYSFAQPNDYGLKVTFSDQAMSSLHGDGNPNGYQPDTVITTFWIGTTLATANGDSAEFSLDIDSLNLGKCGNPFGLAVYHHWFASIGNDYGWPSNQWFDQPRTWQLLDFSGLPDCGGKIAYVTQGEASAAQSFTALLTAAGYTVDLVPLALVSSTDFTQYDLILIANDTGYLDKWGTPGLTASQVSQIKLGAKPIIGLGEGGYAFFGRLSLFIGWPQGWHGPQDIIQRPANFPPLFYFGIPDGLVQDYLDPTNSVGIYLPPNAIPGDVVPVGLEDPTVDHAGLIYQGCQLLWGNSGSPDGMTASGKNLFLNTVQFMRNDGCHPPPVVTPDCLAVSKTADPDPGVSIAPGQIIQYKLDYTFSNVQACNNPAQGKLLDHIPENTVFIPGSASDGLSPGPDGALIWTVTPAAAQQSKTFKVEYLPKQCAPVTNQATLLVSGSDPLTSAEITHPVTCPPISLPTDQPMYAEDELQVNPYPLIAGQLSQVSLRVTNLTADPQPVTANLASSGNSFGIGLEYTVFATSSTVIPAYGTAVLNGVLTPAASGLSSFQAEITGPNLNPSLITQRTLDVTEDFSNRGTNTLTFSVRNNTSNGGDITLVVDNNCPGWSASITDPTSGVMAAMASGETRSATLSVSPPTALVLGSGCHIDVQAWIGGKLIGGIRKLDVPPVSLPRHVLPAWEEPEITFNPDPPVEGQPGQICIDLQNPLPVSRHVFIDFSSADFGAGIGFTPVGTIEETLPPNSFARYCIAWTPAAGGTLHRCVLVTLRQDGYQNQTSQHNVDIVPTSGGLASLNIPFVVANPDLLDHALQIETLLVGIDPYWQPVITLGNGDPAPNTIKAGQTLSLFLHFGAFGKSPQAPPPDYGYGDSRKIETTILLDGIPAGGFSVELQTVKVYLPFVRK